MGVPKLIYFAIRELHVCVVVIGSVLGRVDH